MFSKKFLLLGTTALAAVALLSMNIASNANQSPASEIATDVSAPAVTENTVPSPAVTENSASAPTTTENSAPAPAAIRNSIAQNNQLAALTSPQVPTISGELAFNAAHPGSWMKFIDPASHMQMHKMFANPASYTQFMQPQFYMEFVKPENLMAWMNLASYQVMLDQQTMSYWMNPTSYTHMMEPAMYQETMDPANHIIYLNPNTYLAALTGSQTCDPDNPNKTPGWFGGGC